MQTIHSLFKKAKEARWPVEHQSQPNVEAHIDKTARGWKGKVRMIGLNQTLAEMEFEGQTKQAIIAMLQSVLGGLQQMGPDIQEP